MSMDIRFNAIAREEVDVEIKNQTLEYLSDIMDGTEDIYWPAAKAAHGR